MTYLLKPLTRRSVRPSAGLGRAWLTLLGAAAAFTTALPVVFGQTETPTASISPPVQEVGAVPVCGVLHNESKRVTDGAFLQALARVFAPRVVQLNCVPLPPCAAQLSVVFSPEQRELSVTFSDSTRGAVTRVLQAPEREQEAPEMAAFLALDLSRRDVNRAGDSHALLVPSELPAVQASVAPTLTPDAGEQSAEPRHHRVANAALFYPLATNYNDPDLKTAIDVNLIYGKVGELEGIQFGTVNYVQGSVFGGQLAAAVNTTRGSLTGVSVAGLVGYAGSLAGVQLAGLANVSAGPTDGAQVAFLGNISGGALRGAQASVLLNKAGGNSAGLQASFGGNIANSLVGAQLSPLVNIARNVSGIQLGLVNVGKRVRGSQIGLVNIAEETDGFPLGLVSVSKSGGIHLSAWASYTALANLGLRFATRNTYTMFTLGYHHANNSGAVGPGFVVGARVPVVSKFAIDIDVGADYLIGAKLCCFDDSAADSRARAKDRHHYRARVMPTWQPYPHFSVFAGGGLALQVPIAFYANDKTEDRTVKLGPEVLFGVSL